MTVSALLSSALAAALPTPASNTAGALPQAGAVAPHPSNAPRAMSTVARPCAVVFAVADSMPGARRCDVVARAVALGVNPNTAHKQYQDWRKARGITGRTAAPRVAVASMSADALRALLADAIAREGK